MRVLFLSTQVDPFAKTGGLGDVSGSLPPVLKNFGIDVRIAMPKYRTVRASGKEARLDGVLVYFIENHSFFDRLGIYGEKGEEYPDNLERFQFFCSSVLDRVREEDFQPDVIHCHDWHTALVPIFLSTRLREDPFWKGIKTVFTIHNLGYQGVFPKEDFPKTGLDWSLFHMEALEFYGKVNLLKGGIVFSDWLTTVSPTYSREIQTPEFGHGLEGVLVKRRDRLTGILNGIDMMAWNPETDREIARPFSKENPSGKIENKRDLQQQCRLPATPTAPLFGIVSRLAGQKGIDLVIEGIPSLLSQNIQLVVLGSGEVRFENALQKFARKFPRKLSVHPEFDPVLARKIYAGCDFFLMPSQYEPCGISQMIALRYGTIPIARATGGLADTITDVTSSPQGNGFLFHAYRTEALLETMQRAYNLYRKPERFGLLIRRAMRCDFSWNRSAEKYVALYTALCSEKERSKRC